MHKSIYFYKKLLIQNKKYVKEFCKNEMVFHDALVRDNHDYAIHDVGGRKYYSYPTER